MNYSLAHSSFFLFCVLILVSCQPEASTQTESTDKPNIIFLLTDDQRWDAMGAMGNEEIVTPEMDRLAAEGVLFKNAYVTTPICCTSRASLLSGQYARRHRINDFVTSFSDSAWRQCYPSLLKEVGYYTGFVGKFGVGKGPDMPASDFDYWQGIPGQPKYEQTDEAGNYQHLTSIMGDQSLAFLEEAPQEQPFCLSVSFKAPHVQDTDPRQFLYDSAFIDLLAYDTMPPPRVGDVFEDFPDFFTENNEARRRWEMRFSTEEKYQASVKGYYRLIYGVDVVIGRIREKLVEKGVADNTIIVLMGDNGFFLGEKGLAGKWYIFEESIRVPLVIYDPRLPDNQKGQIIDEIALNIDIAPTLLRMAEVEIPAAIQGSDLSPLFTGQTVDWRTDFLFEHEFEHPRIPKSEGVVSLRDKYVRYLPPAPEYEEYYDLMEDPLEEENLIDEPSLVSEIEARRERLESLLAEMK